MLMTAFCTSENHSSRLSDRSPRSHSYHILSHLGAGMSFTIMAGGTGPVQGWDTGNVRCDNCLLFPKCIADCEGCVYLCVTGLGIGTFAVSMSCSTRRACVLRQSLCFPGEFFSSIAPLSVYTRVILCNKRCLCPKSQCASTDTFLFHKEIQGAWEASQSTWNSGSK